MNLRLRLAAVLLALALPCAAQTELISGPSGNFGTVSAPAAMAAADALGGFSQVSEILPGVSGLNMEDAASRNAVAPILSCLTHQGYVIKPGADGKNPYLAKDWTADKTDLIWADMKAALSQARANVRLEARRLVRRASDPRADQDSLAYAVAGLRLLDGGYSIYLDAKEKKEVAAAIESGRSRILPQNVLKVAEAMAQWLGEGASKKDEVRSNPSGRRNYGLGATSDVVRKLGMKQRPDFADLHKVTIQRQDGVQVLNEIPREGLVRNLDFADLERRISKRNAKVSRKGGDSSKLIDVHKIPQTPEELAKCDADLAARGIEGSISERKEHRTIYDEPWQKADLQADFINIGMGPTGMMSMLAAIANGRTAVGVELRGAPTRGVHMNIREEWFHVLETIDRLMVERYGEEGLPKLPNGRPWHLADFLYNPDRVGGALDFPDVYGDLLKKRGLLQAQPNQNLAGRLTRVMFEDARSETLKDNDGKAKLYVLPPPALPDKADPNKLTGDMKAVLDSPSAFQVALINYELMLRNYLKAMERQDQALGRKPRVKVYENSRVAQLNGKAEGYVKASGGKKRIVIEQVADEGGDTGTANRVRKESTALIDLGVPVRWTLTPGFGGGADAKTLGYEQEEVVYNDPEAGEEVHAKQNWIVAEVTANLGGQLLRRISSYVDPKTGKSEVLRQIAVGHEHAPNVAWIPIQVPSTMNFDPIEAGKVPAGSDPKSTLYKEASQAMVLDYYVSQVSAVTHIPEADIRRMRMFYGPQFFTLQEKIGKTARLADNGNVAGDLMGNGHFLTSGGAMTGMIGHEQAFLVYWDRLNHGWPESKAAGELESNIKTATEAWLHVSAKEFFDLLPANFGQQRAKAIGISSQKGVVNSVSAKGAYGLAQVLGSQSWAKSFMRLLRGEFGKPNVDFYVPDREVDLTQSPNVTVVKVQLEKTKPGSTK